MVKAVVELAMKVNMVRDLPEDSGPSLDQDFRMEGNTVGYILGEASKGYVGAAAGGGHGWQ